MPPETADRDEGANVNTADTAAVKTSFVRQLTGDWRFRVGLVAALALVPRAVYLSQIQSWPFFYHPVLDSRTQLKWATILLDTHWIGNSEVTAKAPLYTYFLAVHQWVFDDVQYTLFAARLVQLALGAITCGLVYVLGRRVFGEAVGIAAGVLSALYSPGLYRDGQLLDTALAAFLVMCLALALLRSLDEPTTQRWLGTGLLLGLLGLTRPNLLLLMLLAIAFIGLWLRKPLGPRRTARVAGALILGTILPILPITGRNYLLTGRFLPISSFGGINLHTGSNPNADGYSPVPSGIAWERTWSEAAAAGATSPVSQDAYWRRTALRFWRDQPGRAIALLGRKTYLFWQAHEIPNNVSYDWGRQRASMLRLMPLTFAVIGPLGLLGLVLGGRRTRETRTLALLILALMLAVAVFFVCGRFRMPAVPLLCVFSGFALVEIVRSIGARRWGAVAFSVIVLAGSAALVNSDLCRVRTSQGANRDWYYVGQSYVMAGERKLAAQALRQGVERDPDDADALSLLGQMEVQMDRPQEAAEHLRRALDVAPDYTLAAAVLAELHLRQGWPLEGPEGSLRRALEQQLNSPNVVRGITALAKVNLRRGDLPEARENILLAHSRLSSWGGRDTRAIPLRAELSGVAAEAKARGVDLPEGF
jgi:4-amino-4-deoxy-L-arabinose transferase-like glycosyltransferase